MKCTVKVNNQRLSGPSLCRSPFRKLNTESSIGASQSTNQKQEWPVAARFVNGSALNEHCYKGPSKDASYQVLIHLAKRFQRRFFRNQPIRNKNGLWWPCLLTNRDEMSILYRGPSIDAAYHVSVHLAKRLQRRRLKKIGQSETRIVGGGHVCQRIRTK